MSGRFLRILIFLILSAGPLRAANYLLCSAAYELIATSHEFRLVHSLDEANALDLEPGDTLFLLAGGRWEGMLALTAADSGSKERPVVIMQWGDGAAPLLTGFHKAGAVEGGQQGELVFPLNSTDTVYQLLWNGILQTPARYPNRGWLRAPVGSTRTGMVDKGFSNDWSGCRIRMRSVHWAYEYRQIARLSNDSLVFDRPTEYGIPPGWGYFLEGLPGLDTAGEWALDRLRTCLRWRQPSSRTLPDEFLLSMHPTGVRIGPGCTHVKIRDLALSGYGVSGITLEPGCSSITIERVTVMQSAGSGIQAVARDSMDAVRAIRVYDSRVEACAGIGIHLGAAYDCIVSRNVLRNIGLYPGYGWSGTNGMTGILIEWGGGNVVERNRLDSIGYNGIRVDGRQNLIAFNRVEQAMLRCSDGAAFYTCGTHSFGSRWIQNYCDRIPGSNEGIPGEYGNQANGMYLDNDVSEVQVIGNVFSRVATFGIANNWGASRNTLRDNILYLPGEAGLAVNPSHKPGATGRLQFLRNTILTSGSEVPAILIYGQGDPRFQPFAVSDSNAFYCAMDPVRMAIGQQDGLVLLSLEGWQERMRCDQHVVAHGAIFDTSHVDVRLPWKRIDLDPNPSSGMQWEFVENDTGLYAGTVNIPPLPLKENVRELNRLVLLTPGASNLRIRFSATTLEERGIEIGLRPDQSGMPGDWISRYFVTLKTGQADYIVDLPLKPRHWKLWLSVRLSPGTLPLTFDHWTLSMRAQDRTMQDRIRREFPLLFNFGEIPGDFVPEPTESDGRRASPIRLEPFTGRVLLHE